MQKKTDKTQSDAAVKAGAEVESEALSERQVWSKENGVALADIKVTKVGYFDPDERARAKARSRERDDEALRSGRVSREELQRTNGGGGIFKNIRISHQPRFRGSVKLTKPDE